MVHDINQWGVHRKPKTTTALKAMTKAELIEYIRILEHDYNVAVDFNELQARNIEQMVKDGKLIEVIRCKDCWCYDTGAGYDGWGLCERYDQDRKDNDYCSFGELKELEGAKE